MKRKNKINLVLSAILVFCLLIVGILLLAHRSVGGKLDSQTVADRWGSDENKFMQISLFLDRNLGVDKSTILNLEEKISEKVNEQIPSESENKKNFLSTYSAKTEVNAENNGKSTSLQAYFTSDNFFSFHSLSIVSGWYYNEYDIMDDGVLINTYAAWKLFGGYDLSDMSITIDGYPCIVLGVFDDSGENVDALPMLYADYDLLYKMGKRDVPITCFEAVLPEPVKDFAENTVRESIDFKDSQFELVNNTKRYNFKECFLQIPKFFTRTDRNTSVYFPKWENEARRIESISILLVFFISVFSVYPILLLISLITFIYIKKGIIFTYIVLFLKKAYKTLREKIRENHNKKSFKSLFRKDGRNEKN